MICIAVGKCNEDVFNMLKESGLFLLAISFLGVFNKILDLHKSPDILLQMTAAELIDSLSVFDEGINFLISENEFEAIAERIHGEEDLLKLHGRLRSLSDLIGKRPLLLNQILHLSGGVFLSSVNACLNEDQTDISSILCALHCLGMVGELAEGRRQIFESCGGDQLLEAVTDKFRHASNLEVAIAGAHTWIKWLHDGTILGKKDKSEVDKKICSFVEKRLMKEFTSCFVNRPFPELRCFIYRLGACLCAFKDNKACCMMLLSHDSCRAIILDFNSDQDNETRYAKHELQKAIIDSQSEWLPTVLGSTDTERLRKFATNGPYWIPPDMNPDIATSGKEQS